MVFLFQGFIGMQKSVLINRFQEELEGFLSIDDHKPSRPAYNTQYWASLHVVLPISYVYYRCIL